MDNKLELTPEEIEKEIEKAKQNIQKMLSEMTPEQREQAELNAKKLIEQDNAEMQKMIDEAAALTKDVPVNKPKFCSNCGAPAGEGKFCSFCGTPFQNS